MKTLILGFYGIGKTTYVKQNPRAVDITDYKFDSFNCDPEALKRFYESDDYDIILADPQWTKIFLQSGYPFYIIIPTMNRKDEFLNNFLKRWADGSWKADIVNFYKQLSTYWEGWLDFYKYKIPCRGVIELYKGQWLADVIDNINE